MQYIGLSKQIRKSVENHALNIGPREAGSLISSVRVAAMPGATKELLKGTWESWIKEHMDGGGEIPAGNLPENSPGSDPRWRSQRNQAKPSLNLGGVAGITSAEEAMTAVKKAVEQYPVIIFMKGTPVMPQCGFSARSVGILKEIGVPFESVNVLDDQTNPGIRDAVKRYSNWPTIPQLFVKGQLVGGADIMSEMFESGQLSKTLRDAVTGASTAGAATASTGAAAVPAVKGQISLVDDPRRPTATALCKALNTNFQLYGLRVMDESSQHEGDAGALEMGITGESHFKVEIVAPEFEGLTPVQRQQKVFQVLSDVMPRIHALSLVTRTPAEVAA